MSKFIYFERVMKICFKIILSMGCFWQIFNVCELYFNYPTNVFINTSFEPLSKPVPALTFCTNIGTNTGLNSSDALEMYSKKFKYKFRDISIWGSSGQGHSLLKEYLDNAIERISLNFYCITFNSILKANKTTKLKSSERMWIWIEDFGYLDSWWLYLHNSYYIPDSSDWNSIELKKSNNYRLTWKLKAFHLLESPYRTNCQNYRKSSQFLSRRDCLRKCKLNITVTQCGHILEDIDLKRDETSVQFGDPRKKSCLESNDLDSVCEKVCPHYDCVIEYYEPINMHKFNVEYCEVQLLIPLKPETTYFHSPRIQSIEFICYLASTMSMWFGLSLYSFNEVFNIFSKQLYNLVNKHHLNEQKRPKSQNKLNWAIIKNSKGNLTRPSIHRW